MNCKVVGLQYTGFMTHTPNLILLGGSIGAGKTTLAERYVRDRPLALHLKRDELITMLGRWLEHEDDAEAAVVELMKSMARTHLKDGHDVIVPYMLFEPRHAQVFEEIAHSQGANFFEIVLDVTKEETVAFALERGSWGEPGTHPITEKDIPIIQSKYDSMMRALKERPATVYLPARKGSVEETYQELLRTVAPS